MNFREHPYLCCYKWITFVDFSQSIQHFGEFGWINRFHGNLDHWTCVELEWAKDVHLSRDKDQEMKMFKPKINLYSIATSRTGLDFIIISSSLSLIPCSYEGTHISDKHIRSAKCRIYSLPTGMNLHKHQLDLLDQHSKSVKI